MRFCALFIEIRAEKLFLCTFDSILGGNSRSESLVRSSHVGSSRKFEGFEIFATLRTAQSKILLTFTNCALRRPKYF